MIFSRKSYEVTNHPDELVCRRRHDGTVYLSAIATVGYVYLVFTDPFFTEFKNKTGVVISIAGMALLLGYLWYASFDKRPRLIINSKGIWTSKRELSGWDNIYYYCFNEKVPRKKNVFLEIRLIAPEEYFEIPLSELDKSVAEIEAAIGKNKKYTVHDLGRTDLTTMGDSVSHF